MSLSNQTQDVQVEESVSTDAKQWTYKDFVWVLSLFGTAVGAGVLFLPIKAGIGGFGTLVALALLTIPLTWYAHKGLARFVLSAKNPNADITDTVEEHFGKSGANIITFAYFFALFPIVLIYGVGITNTVDTFIVNQLGMASPPRWLLSGVLIVSMTAAVVFGRELMLRVTSWMVYPLVAIIFGLSVYLIPDWQMSMISEPVDFGALPKTIWLALPIVVFSFNHAAIISQFSKDQRAEFGNKAVVKTDKITGGAAFLAMGFIMFFVFSVVLSMTPEQLAEAKAQNISIVSYLANVKNSAVISFFGPLIAFTAIASSYFGHFLGAHEGLVGLVKSRTSYSVSSINKFSIVFIVISTWISAIINPGVLDMIESLGAPMMIVITFLLPVYAMYKIPAMAKYITPSYERIFTLFFGIAAFSSVLYGLLK